MNYEENHIQFPFRQSYINAITAASQLGELRIFPAVPDNRDPLAGGII
jgi:hypothetical protein